MTGLGLNLRLTALLGKKKVITDVMLTVSMEMGWSLWCNIHTLSRQHWRTVMWLCLWRRCRWSESEKYRQEEPWWSHSSTVVYVRPCGGVLQYYGYYCWQYWRRAPPSCWLTDWRQEAETTVEQDVVRKPHSSSLVEKVVCFSILPLSPIAFLCFIFLKHLILL